VLPACKTVELRTQLPFVTNHLTITARYNILSCKLFSQFNKLTQSFFDNNSSAKVNPHTLEQ